MSNQTLPEIWYDYHMKTTVVIAEFNPFHNGHKYILDQAGNLTSSDYIVVIMSGSFVQRGEPAFMHKNDRVKAALNSGADVVLELPVSYSTATAETFAFGAVSIADQIGVTDCLAFGAEHADLDNIKTVAETLTNPSAELTASIESGIRKGLSYPAARAAALPDNADILKEPNNILAIEYLKALIKTKSSITPFPVKRIGNAYNDGSLISEYPSALSIRNMINTGDDQIAWDSLRKSMPKAAFKILSEAYKKTAPISINDLSSILDHIMIGSEASYLSSYQDMNPDIACRLIRSYNEMLDNAYKNASPFTIDSLLKSMRTKELTYSRLSRALIHVVLGLKDLTTDNSGALLPCPYTRILGFKKDASALMRKLSDCSAIPLINKPADAEKMLREHAYEFFDSTIRSDRLYDSLIKNKYGTILNDTCRQGPMII